MILLGAWPLLADAQFMLLVVLVRRVAIPAALGTAMMVVWTSAGRGVLTRFGLLPDVLGLQIAFSMGFGLGLLSFGTLGAGLVGLLDARVFWAAHAAIGALSFRQMRRMGADLAERIRSWRQAAGRGYVLVGMVSLLFLINVLSAMSPPWEYDVQEYHLGAPSQYAREGRVYFLQHNVYANFPANVEMWYLAAMTLARDNVVGAAGGKMLNVWLGLALACGVAATARILFRPVRSPLAWLVLYACPALTVFSGVAYVEMGLCFYTFLSVASFMLYVRGGRTASLNGTRWLVVSGVSAGLAAGTKYPALLFAVAPLAAGAALVGLWRSRSAVRDGALFAAAAILVFSPWLAKNYAYTGNPTYPLLHSVFARVGAAEWSQAQDARFRQAHAPGPFELREGVRRVQQFFTNENQRYLNPLAFLFIPGLILCGRRLGRFGGPLIAYVALYFVLWFAFTHRIDRFMAPVIPVLALLSAGGLGCVKNAMGRRACLGVGAFCSALGLVQSATIASVTFGAFTYPMGMESIDKFMADRTDFARPFDVIRYVNRELPASAKILFVGEVRGFYCNRAWEADIVFDNNRLERAFAEAPTLDAVRVRLRDEGLTHLLINVPELFRLQHTYRYTLGGVEHLGMLDGFNWARFDAFRKRYLTEVYRQGPAIDWAKLDRLRQMQVEAGKTAFAGPIVLFELKGPARRREGPPA